MEMWNLLLANNFQQQVCMKSFKFLCIPNKLSSGDKFSIRQPQHARDTSHHSLNSSNYARVVSLLRD